MVELADHAQRRRGDRRQQGAAVVGDETVDRRAARRRPATRAIAARCPAIAAGGDVRPGDRAEHLVGEVGRLDGPASSGASRAARHSSGLVPSSPKAGLVDSSVRLRTRDRVPGGDVLGDHPAERDADEVRRGGAERVEEVDRPRRPASANVERSPASGRDAP